MITKGNYLLKKFIYSIRKEKGIREIFLEQLNGNLKSTSNFFRTTSVCLWPGFWQLSVIGSLFMHAFSGKDWLVKICKAVFLKFLSCKTGFKTLKKKWEQWLQLLNFL